MWPFKYQQPREGCVAKKTRHSRKPHPKRTHSFERLETRNLMAPVVTLDDRRICIVGTDRNDTAEISLQDYSKVTVSYWSQGETRKTKSFAAKDVDEIGFAGLDGDDTFKNYTNIHCWAYGEGGNDTLVGGGNHDFLWGGGGKDRLEGNGGDDTLYGGPGDDRLYGGSGCDGLYGGPGSDRLYGAGGSDRFLENYGQTERQDPVEGEDAVIFFRNDKRSWTEGAIENVDLGLMRLHHRTRNDNLLEMPNGGPVTFWRGSANSDVAGTNFGNGKIVLYDGAFSSEGWTAETAIHEMAHNWGATPQSDWAKWLTRSGWRDTAPPKADASRYAKSLDGKWWYRVDAVFASTYGKTNPDEDWATAWESYCYYHRLTSDINYGGGNLKLLPTNKESHLDRFFSSLV